MLATLVRPLALMLLPLFLPMGTAPPALSQVKPAQNSLQTAPSAPRPAVDAGSQQQPQPQVSVPDDNRLAILIHTSLIALNQANLTGNYSVLRDLAAPGFQSANSSAKLADIFSRLRGQRLDLSPIVLFTPKLNRPAAIDERGLLTLSGFFETQPQRVQFDLLFQPVGGQWQLFGVSITMAPANAVMADTSKNAPAPKAAAKAAALKPASEKKK